MIETIIQVDKDAYPFDEPISHTGIVSVEAIHEFTSLEELLAKKRVMQPKTKVHGCLHVIKLKKIYQQDLRLHFIYEYVPYSLRSYISQLTDTETSQHVSQMTRQLFISKLDHQLTILVGYLVEASLRIQLQFECLGVDNEEQIKLFVSSHRDSCSDSKEILMMHYLVLKNKVMERVNLQYRVNTKKEIPRPNFIIKGNKLVFPEVECNASRLDPNDANFCFNSSINDSSIFPDKRNIFTENNFPSKPLSSHDNLRRTQSPNYSTNFNFRDSKRKNRSHKSSFQFGSSRIGKQPINPNRSFDEDNSDARSYTHSKSIRIQLQQKKNENDFKKKRKDSYKVKITTMHEYQMDQCPNVENLFSQAKKTSDFGNDHTDFNAETSNRDDFFDSTDEVPPSNGSRTKQSYKTNINLEQKIRQARQKAETVLHQYLKTKKKEHSFNCSAS